MVNQWQPIETAPKDGTSILAYWPSLEPQEIESIFIIYWSDIQACEIYDYLDEDENPEAKAIVAGGWLFTTSSIDKEHTSYDMSEGTLLNWLHYSVIDGPTHWMLCPEPPDGP